jgi:hypothetical protein
LRKLPALFTLSTLCGVLNGICELLLLLVLALELALAIVFAFAFAFVASEVLRLTCDSVESVDCEPDVATANALVASVLLILHKFLFFN